MMIWMLLTVTLNVEVNEKTTVAFANVPLTKGIKVFRTLSNTSVIPSGID